MESTLTSLDLLIIVGYLVGLAAIASRSPSIREPFELATGYWQLTASGRLQPRRLQLRRARDAGIDSAHVSTAVAAPMM
jgi:hypothetical protein